MSSSLIQSWLEPFNYQQLRDNFFRVIQVAAAIALFAPSSHFYWQAKNGGEGVQTWGLGVLGDPLIALQREGIGFISELQYGAPAFSIAPTFWYFVAAIILLLLSFKLPKRVRK